MRRILDNFALVRRKMVDLNERDHIRNFKPPVDGTEIMETFGISGRSGGRPDQSAIKNAVLDGVIHNDHEEARELMLRLAAEQGLYPVSGAKEQEGIS